MVIMPFQLKQKPAMTIYVTMREDNFFIQPGRPLLTAGGRFVFTTQILLIRVSEKLIG